MREEFFPQPETHRRHFQKFIFLYEIQALLKRQNNRRIKLNGHIRRGAVDIGKPLRFTYVNFNIVCAVVHADNHALVYRHARTDERTAALLHRCQRVGRRFTGLKGNQHTAAQFRNAGRYRKISDKSRREYAVAAGFGQNIAAETQ